MQNFYSTIKIMRNKSDFVLQILLLLLVKSARDARDVVNNNINIIIDCNVIRLLLSYKLCRYKI